MKFKVILIFIVFALIISSCALKPTYPTISVNVMNVTYDSAEFQWQYGDNVERVTKVKLRTSEELLYTFEATNNLTINDLNPGETYYVYFIPEGYNVVLHSETINTPRSNDSTGPVISSMNVLANKATVITYDVPSGIKQVKFSIQSNELIPTRLDYKMQYHYPNTWVVNYSLPYKSEWTWQVTAIDKSLNTTIATGVINN